MGEDEGLRIGQEQPGEMGYPDEMMGEQDQFQENQPSQEFTGEPYADAQQDLGDSLAVWVRGAILKVKILIGDFL